MDVERNKQKEEDLPVLKEMCKKWSQVKQAWNV